MKIAIVIDIFHDRVTCLEGLVYTLRFTRGYDYSKKPPNYSVVFYRIIFAFIGNPNFILQISPLKCLLR